ncbi:fatty-acid amide hydrolase 1-like [Nomascus leucogenys]|uniref:fatty-acid amide hydrolase 1-like n=1 Tax=Nomascus leucogenys TaxID=61853 RepID=UPI00122D81A6|nr:fatty-acid amide hydrolase 1-like [Nomascus leucogenys]
MASGPQVPASATLELPLPSRGKKSVTTVASPMARDVGSLALSLQALLSEDMYRLDPTMPQMPFREEVKTPFPTPGCSE